MIKNRSFYRNRNNGSAGIPAGLIVFLLVAACALFLTSCGKKDASAEETEETLQEAEQKENIYYYTEENQAAYDRLQAEMEAGEYGLALAYLGNGKKLAESLTGEEPDYQAADEQLAEILERSSLAEKWPFLSSIHSYRILQIGEGTDLYLAVPDQSASGLELCELKDEDEGTDRKGATAAKISGTYPVLFLADSAYLEESGGRGIQAELSGNGVIPENVLELSSLSGEVHPEDLEGLWKAAAITDDAGAAYDIFMKTGSSGSLELWYRDAAEEEQETGAEAESTEEQQPDALMHYTGTLESQGDGRFVFHLKADSGRYVKESMPEISLECICRLGFGDEEKTKLLMTRISGDPFFTGIMEEELFFRRVAGSEENAEERTAVPGSAEPGQDLPVPSAEAAPEAEPVTGEAGGGEAAAGEAGEAA